MAIIELTILFGNSKIRKLSPLIKFYLPIFLASNTQASVVLNSLKLTEPSPIFNTKKNKSSKLYREKIDAKCILCQYEYTTIKVYGDTKLRQQVATMHLPFLSAARNATLTWSSRGLCPKVRANSMREIWPSSLTS